MTLDLPLVIHEYVRKMLRDASVGMKAFLLDEFTMNVVSAAFTQTELLQMEVFLVEKLRTFPAKKMQHLKALCFVRPIEENITIIIDYMKRQTFGGYYIFFSHIVKETLLQRLAERDEKDAIFLVQEVFASFVAIDSFLFTFSVLKQNTRLALTATDMKCCDESTDKVVGDIAAFFLSIKRRPSIRFQGSSERCRKVAEGFRHIAYEQEPELFDFRQNSGSSQLLVLDRMYDPVTPLLSQWTYQAMLHELFGIRGNRVRLSASANESQELVISSTSDEFYAKNMYSNYGDLGLAINELVDDFQAISKFNKQLDSIEDMQRFVENFPEFRQQSGNVSKHVTLMSEMSKLISENSLLAVSQVEQEIVCGSDRPYACRAVMDRLSDHKVKPFERLKLVLLFALRYGHEGSHQVDEMIATLSQQNVEYTNTMSLQHIIKLMRANTRISDLFGNQNFLARASKLVGGLKGDDTGKACLTEHQKSSSVATARTHLHFLNRLD